MRGVFMRLRSFLVRSTDFDTALIHLIRCPKAENLPRCFIEKSHRLPDRLCCHCPEVGAPGNSPFQAGRAEN